MVCPGPCKWQQQDLLWQLLSNLELFLGSCTHTKTETLLGLLEHSRKIQKPKLPKQIFLCASCLSLPVISRHTPEGEWAQWHVSTAQRPCLLSWPLSSVWIKWSVLWHIGTCQGVGAPSRPLVGGKLVLETVLTCLGLRLNSEPSPEPPCIMVPGPDMDLI